MIRYSLLLKFLLLYISIYVDPRAHFACFQHELQNISTSVENSMQNMPEGRLMLADHSDGQKRV
jgi:hypothetical protein